MSFPPLLTPSEARPLFPRARGACRPAASPRPERSTQYLRQPTPAHVAYRRCLLLQRNPSQPGHSSRYSSKFLHFPYIGLCPIYSKLTLSCFSLLERDSRRSIFCSGPVSARQLSHHRYFFRFLSRLDLHTPY